MVNYKANSLIHLEAKSSTITAEDLIEFKEKDGGTEITYNADISLRHILWLLTPFVKGDFQELANNAKKGMEAKCKELFN